MQKLLIIRGRNITHADIGLIRSLVHKYSNRSRSYISKKLAEKWCWFQSNGRLKDRACRDILTALETKRLIDLPPFRLNAKSSKKQHNSLYPSVNVDVSLMQVKLKDFKPFENKIFFS